MASLWSPPVQAVFRWGAVAAGLLLFPFAVLVDGFMSQAAARWPRWAGLQWYCSACGTVLVGLVFWLGVAYCLAPGLSPGVCVGPACSRAFGVVNSSFTNTTAVPSWGALLGRWPSPRAYPEAEDVLFGATITVAFDFGSCIRAAAAAAVVLTATLGVLCVRILLLIMQQPLSAVIIIGGLWLTAGS